MKENNDDDVNDQENYKSKNQMDHCIIRNIRVKAVGGSNSSMMSGA